MSVVVAEQDVGPWRKQLTIEIPAPAVEAEEARVAIEYSRHAKLPGFRKGKVPKSLVERRFADEIKKEVLDRLLPRYWKQAQAEKQIEPLMAPEVSEVGTLIVGAPLTFTATVEVRPTIERLDLEDFRLPAMDIEVGPEDIEQALEGIRKERSTWQKVDRPAGQGDMVHAEVVEVDSDGQPVAEPQHGHFEIGDPQVWEEVSVALAGLAAGQKGGFVHRTPTPAEPPSEDSEGATPTPDRNFRFTVERVDERVLPEVDDELAKSLALADLDALRAQIAARIGEAKRSELRRRRQQAVLDQLRERHPLELPAGVVRQEIEGLLGEYAEELGRSGVDLEKTQLDWQKIGEEARPQAERRVHSRLLLDAVAAARALTVDEEDLERALASIGRAHGQSSQQVRQTLDKQGRLGSLRTQLRRDKTLAVLLGEPSGA